MIDPTDKTQESTKIPADKGDKIDETDGNLGFAATAATLSGSGCSDEADEAIAPTSHRKTKDPMIGRCLSDRYLIEGQLGHGGMGMVYKARHQRLNKPLAVKLIHSEMARNELSLARFEREAKLAASLDHEYIVDVIDYGQTEDEMAYMVMEYLEGQTVEELIKKEGPLPTGRATVIAWQIAKGLRVAHEAGMIHRDLKSANVFLTDREGRDSVKLLDFGISKMSESSEEEIQLTGTGVVMGTPNYLAPEQAKGEKDLDHRVDLYALGVIFCEMLTGKPPFSGSNVLELAYKHISVAPNPPSEIREDLEIPDELDAIVLRCLEKEADQRYQTAVEFMEALPDPTTLSGGWSMMSSLPGSGPITAPVAATAQPPRSHRRFFFLALGIGAIVGGLVVAVPMLRHSPPPPQVDAASNTVVPATELDAANRALHEAAPADTGAAVTESIILEVQPSVPGAKVYLNGELRGTGSVSIDLAINGDPQEIMIKARGYRTVTRSIQPTSNETITVVLDRLPPRRDLPQKTPTSPSLPDMRANPYGNNQ